MKHALAIALFCAPFGVCAAAPAAAQSASNSASSEVITSTSIGEMIDMVGAMGYEVSRLERAPNTLRVVSDRGRIFGLSLEMCDGADFTLCKSLELEMSRSEVPNLSYEMVNELNARQTISQLSYNTRRETMVGRRFIILKDGVTLANVKENISAFLGMYEVLTPLIDEIAERQN